MADEMEVEPVFDTAASQAKSDKDETSNNTNNNNTEPLVRSYLAQIWKASQQLATPARDDAMECDDIGQNDEEEEEESFRDLNDYMDRIARNLLTACRLSILSTGIDNLPEKIYPQSEHDPVPTDEDEEEEVDKDRYYSRRRIDYLRLLLRAMPPISMDVAARICSVLLAASVVTDDIDQEQQQQKQQQQQQQQQEQIPLELAQSAFCLFSVWLPAAPHIAPLVSDLFALDSFPCPVATTTTTTTTTTMNDTLPKEHAWLLAEAAHHICYFYCRKRQEQKTLLKWWNWGPIFQWTILDENDGDAAADDDNNNNNSSSRVTMAARAMQWHAVRSAAFVLNLAPGVKANYFRHHGVQEQIVPWVIHPWEIDHEEFVVQKLFRKHKTEIWDKPFLMPTVADVRLFVPLHPFLVELAKGLVFVKHDAIQAAVAESPTTTTKPKTSYHQRLVRTPTTAKNLTRVGIAMCRGTCPPPILVCGPMGSGKSSLVREVCRMFAAMPREATHHDNRILEIHVDEETDTKTLVGSYTATDIPGEFEWRPGALTRAVRQGKWVLMEDVDTVPVEIQASLVQLLKERLLPLGNGKVEKCHPNFLLFGTLSTHSGVHNTRGRVQSTKRLMNPSLWQRIDVEPLPFTELKHIAIGKHPSLPESIIDSALSIFRAIDRSGRTQEDNVVSLQSTSVWAGRDPSVRDLFKLFSRIDATISFEKGVSYATESQRTLCLAETVDVFAAACPDRDDRRGFVQEIAAPAWGISAELASRYIDTRSPIIQIHPTYTEVGRSRIGVNEIQASNRVQPESFAQTSYASRLLESLAVSVRQNEATLLVGETGTGKTSILQHLAKLAGRDLVVQNLSLQTDSTDLLGGYRPLELHHVARRSYQSFVDLFTSTFSRKQNAEFLAYATTALQRRQWRKLSQCFRRAAKMGLDKVRKRALTGAAGFSPADVESWKNFAVTAERFEQQRLACDSGLAFVFTEGALVDAIRHGKWVLLDEINLASSETLQRLNGLLDDTTSSLTLTERGDSEALNRHPDFRLFAAMNPATDSGKKDLSPNIRSRFTEIYVDELMDPVELRVIAGRYLSGILPVSNRPPEHTDVVIAVVDTYLECRRLSGCRLADGSGQRPRYTLRTLTRALAAARTMVLQQRLSLQRALLEGFSLAFEGPLDAKSLKIVNKAISVLGEDLDSNDLDHPGRRPAGGKKGATFVLLKPFWIKAGPIDPIDLAEETPENGRSNYILTPTTAINLRRLARAVASGPWPVLLEGPTSAGKTSLIEYMAARCGHRVIRINNHEHTDVQEYTGGFAADTKGSLTFQDGLLVRALRRGDWVILDELNLAPSEVLEALNRLLDDNRELFLPEVNEVVKAHPDFRLFATQNPSGAYGGRKPLSRAFRNRFIEMHVGDIPSSEMVSILHLRCGCPPSHSKKLVSIMEALRQRRSRSGVFLGKDGFMTPRDLLRWAERDASSKLDLAREGFMLLAERLRTDEEKEFVKNEIEKQLKVSIDVESMYYGESSEGRQLLEKALMLDSSPNGLVKSVAPTRAILRLVTLALRCIKQREPVLLVGETGCGKTTVVQLLSLVLGSTLHIVNCHATTETSDLLGGLRPVRGRSEAGKEMFGAIRDLGRFLGGNIQERWESVLVPEVVESCWTGDSTENFPAASFPLEKIGHLMEFAKSIIQAEKKREDKPVERDSKRRKLGSEDSPGSGSDLEKSDSISTILKRIEDILYRYFALFEWVDGPLVHAMKRGDMILLDEMSLAEDAVLERLNSVLEPSRTLVLAENGNFAGEEDRLISASQTFQLFATMNPGGDFGKRELSPALRSRFTEIWVPPITTMADVDMVVEHSLRARLPLEQLHTTKKCILSYVEWFNDVVCGDPSSPCGDLSLSLRDILTWARFVVAAFDQNKDLTLNHILMEGARLMHLDGLGLGAGLSSADVAGTRRLAELFLMNLFDKNEAETSRGNAASPVFCVSGNRFGGFPFWIPVGPEPLHDTHFNFHARTTALNVQRVLRAMQLPKPVLLEGSPGVGKTALIRALSEASGHKLVRINLSEQTDIADLMGSDLPVPDEDSCGAGRASFRWCDGVLLLAIKRGDWVLLDELNLASQAVLEGLNSCLDHRSSVFIPELGRTFECPPTFRVFAAQNPLAQGGGRKGLPKSFLNRFTKVYVDALSTDDMEVIASNVFPSVNRGCIQKMVAFNNRVHKEVVDQNHFGHQGSSWEFNLRDIFRWCELLREKGPCCTATHVHDLYIQRFRNSSDRKAIESIYNDIFECDFSGFVAPVMSVGDSEVSVCDVSIPRKSSECGMLESAFPEGRTLFSVSSALVAVARCVEMKWPCLLVGGPSSAKGTVIRTLADVTHTNVIEIALSPSSDVSELVGCFEQVDSMNECRGLVCQLLRHTSQATILTKNKQELHEISRLFFMLQGFVNSENAKPMDWCDIGLKLSSLIQGIEGDVDKAAVSSLVRRLRNLRENDSPENEAAGHFMWKDGVLVEAMINGYWLHLKNANLCPASVLDRLNPVMEPRGSLILSECAADKGGGSSFHRRIECHPDFRIFLSINCEYGEVSRAMRNRCVEISLCGCSDARLNRLDALDGMWESGLRLEGTSNAVFRHAEQKGIVQGHFGSFRATQGVGELACSLMQRNPSLDVICIATGHLNFRLYEDEEDGNDSETPLLPPVSVRDGWSLTHKYSQVLWESRLIRYFVEFDGQKFGSFSSQLLSSWLSLCPKVVSEFLDISSGIGVDQTLVRDSLLSIYLSKIQYSNSDARLRFLSHLNGSLRRSVFFLEDIMSQAVLREPDVMCDSPKSTTWMAFARFPSLLRQHVWLTKRKSRKSVPTSLVGTSILDLAYSDTNGELDQTTLTCALTPFIFPFFEAFDDWFGELSVLDVGRKFPLYWDCLHQRDNLWLLLQNTTYDNHAVSGSVCFDVTDFVVQWMWSRKRARLLENELRRIFPELLVTAKKQVLDRVTHAVERVIFDSTEPNAFDYSMVPKPPLSIIVPRTRQGWAVLRGVRQLSATVSVDRSPCDTARTMDLSSLIGSQRELFLADKELRKEILGALSTVSLASMEGLSFLGLSEVFNSMDGIEKSLRKLISHRDENLMQRLQFIRIDPSGSSQSDGEWRAEELDQKMKNTSDARKSYCTTADYLLQKYASLQLAPYAEAWCEQRELYIIRYLSRMMVKPHRPRRFRDELASLDQTLGAFLDIALAYTLWDIDDLRPFQMLSWVSEANNIDFDNMVKFIQQCLLIMSCNAAKRTWGNSQILLGLLSPVLELPTLLEDPGPEQQRQPRSLSVQEGDENVICSLVFSMLGDISEHRSMHPFATIENYKAREAQVRILIDLLARLRTDINISFPFEIVFLLSDTLGMIKKTFTPEVYHRLSGMLDSLNTFGKENLAQMQELARGSCCHVFRKCFSRLFTPLLRVLEDLQRNSHDSTKASKEMFMAKIYLGALRFHLLVPQSPLDPGRMSLSKTFLIDLQLQRLGNHIFASSLEKFYVEGDDGAGNQIDDVVCEYIRLSAKKARQQKKIVERPDVPPFADFFRETREFARNFLDLDAFLGMVEKLHDLGGNKFKATALLHSKQWQMTARAFHCELLSKYSGYEDIVVPLLGALAMINDGLHDLTRSKESSHLERSQVKDIVEPMLKFPFQICPFHSLVEYVYSIKAKTKRDLACRRALGFASLARLQIEAQVTGMNRHVLSNWLELVEAIAVGVVPADIPSKSMVVQTEEELYEQEYRKHFPDHQREFQELVEAQEDEEPVGFSIASEFPCNIEEIDPKITEIPPLEKKDTLLLASLHEFFFGLDSHSISDSRRLTAFALSYGAAYSLYCNHSGDSGKVSEGVSSGLVMAMSDSMRGSLFESSVRGGIVWNFQRDPNPEEAIKASRPVEAFSSRLVELLTAFPSNAILLAIARVTERVKRFCIHSVPLGKFMAGLELVLKHAQDWEQHASERVRLGRALDEVKVVVSNWRKLELSSWFDLLRSHEVEMSRQAKMHWGRIHTILRGMLNDTKASSDYQGVDPHFCQYDPMPLGWVFKSKTRDLSLPRVDMEDACKLFDTFCLSSPIGEFSTRLDMINCFAKQVEEEAKYSSDDGAATALARSMRSIYLYYRQFSTFFERKMDELRQPLEEKLRKEVKLAKWDEQTYYALAESTERNHRMLMRILREYDESLKQNVGFLLEVELCRGVRGSSDLQDEACSSIPVNSAFFPLPSNEETATPGHLDENVRFPEKWVDVSTINVTDSETIRKLGHFSRKMLSLLHQESKNSGSCATIGHLEAEKFCNAVFERIESLRSEKATRPMKERALVDLFRALRRQGFARTKWTVPLELRQMGQVFQLPQLDPLRLHDGSFVDRMLESSDIYFQRSLSELTRLRSEIAIFGSRHLSSSQLAMAQGFMDHGLLLLIQQRCVLAQTISYCSHLSRMLSRIEEVESELPLSQSLLKTKLLEFQQAYHRSIESARELKLFIATSLHHLQGEKTKWARDAVASLDSLIPVSTAEPSFGFAIVTNRMLHAASQMAENLQGLRRVVKECRDTSIELVCLPVSAFDVCLDLIREALAIGQDMGNAKARQGPTVSAQLNVDDNSSRDIALAKFNGAVEKSVRVSLLAVQTLLKDSMGIPDQGDEEASVWKTHVSTTEAWIASDLKRMVECFHAVLIELRYLHDDPILRIGDRACCTRVVVDLSFLYRTAMKIITHRMQEYCGFHRSCAKLQYVLLRVFRVLASKGFCSSEENEAGETDVSGMNFSNDQEGTGMGEGDGTKDVTDEIENEDQLLGLKGNQKDEKDVAARSEPQQLDEDEAGKGMEMEEDFEGDMYDIPDKPQDDGNTNDKEDIEEELDREMGDEHNSNEEVIDEKMWGDSDDDGDPSQDEKFEKNNSVKGDAAAEEMITREDDCQKEEGVAKDEKQTDTQGLENDGADAADNEETINQDTGEKYEENQGINVREEQRACDLDDRDESEEQLDIDQDLALEDQSEHEDGMENEEEVAPDAAKEGEEEFNGKQKQDPDVSDHTDDEGEKEKLEEPQSNSQAAVEGFENENTEEAIPDEDKGARTELLRQERQPQGLLGIQSADGRDTIQDDRNEETVNEERNCQEEAEGDGCGGEETEPSAQGGSTSGAKQGEISASGGEDGGERRSQNEMPNPIKNPGDATKFWHRRLNVIKSSEAENQAESGQDPLDDRNRETDGDFEYVGSNQESTTQALGEVEDTDALCLEDHTKEEEEECLEAVNVDSVDKNESEQSLTREDRKTQQGRTLIDPDDGKNDEMHEDKETEKYGEDIEEDSDSDDTLQANSNHKDSLVGNQVVSDLSQLNMSGEPLNVPAGDRLIIEEEQTTGISTAEATAARMRWAQIQGETHNLSRRLCEKLRLVMEPLVASKLRGDYRTGKRINMKRVIGYIASGYRKDKIWLRRTKPAKRNYRVLVAVDDSESMLKSGAGVMALKAMATLATGMSQLEIGELGIASFGDEMNLVHPFHQPFTSESGNNVVQHFQFSQQRTRTALCVESAMIALDTPGDQASMQLVFMISDGRIERDSRDELRRLIREMMERNILLAMIIVEGSEKKDSILNMKEVSFEKGKPKVKRFIEDYPFPYYILLDDMQSLPEILGDALRQWFEMLARLQSPGTR